MNRARSDTPGESQLRFGSVCSGIEAASVAWHPLGWRAAWFSEIEPFPSAVLAHHYPDTPNLGDMATIVRRLLTGEIEAPDMLCGGTPCQAFSVAGKRESLSDARGNLSLTFCEIADAIDHVRAARGKQPGIVFWENVPGVLSTRDNAFGCFLGALAGAGCELQPAGGRWTDAGCVYGPARSVAWRVLDAQYFGLAQRRRRVFVVASARNGFDPGSVLFEREGVRRDSAPRREAGQDTAGSTGDGLARCLTTGEAKRQDWETCNMVAHSLRGEGFDASEDGTGRGTPLVPVAFAIQAGALRTNPNSGPDGVGVQADHAYTLEARAEVQAVAFHPTQNPISSTGGSTHALGCGSKGGCATVAVAHPVGVTIHGTDPTVQKVASYDETAQCLRARTPGNIDNSSTTVVQQGMAVRRLTPRECERLQGFPDDYTLIPWRGKPADQCPDGPRYKALGNSWAVPCVRWIGRRIQEALA